jgi:hypothetical protein
MGHIMQPGMNTGEGANRRLSRDTQRAVPPYGRADNSTVASHIARRVGSTPTMPLDKKTHKYTQMQILLHEKSNLLQKTGAYLKFLPRNRRYAEIHRMKGLCIQCPRPRVQGRSRCVRCLKINAILDAKKSAQRNAEGLCVHCGHAVEPGFKYHNRNECYPHRRLTR